MKTLRDRANELARFKCLPTRTSNGGTACTCVVTEYRYHDRPNFAIDVVLFTEADLKEQLRKMLDAYRHNHFHSATMESENERKHWADQAKLAKDTFKAMFGDWCRRGFLSTEALSIHSSAGNDFAFYPCR
ncbi:hypothetical protein NEMBOFW57_009060 [Staphylotrichum longicolle]|uniref:Uncharacterized protein n=1 Tax=Staphylotrichum longicolle TaxID=669026 RepID=A0AAD4ESU6_9PEZI|nr:hypothetical protein NEMBOFW57_009060 [Staphylotrichum longicolle]